MKKTWRNCGQGRQEKVPAVGFSSFHHHLQLLKNSVGDDIDQRERPKMKTAITKEGLTPSKMINPRSIREGLTMNVARLNTSSTMANEMRLTLIWMSKTTRLNTSGNKFSMQLTMQYRRPRPMRPIRPGKYSNLWLTRLRMTAVIWNTLMKLERRHPNTKTV